MNTAEQSGIASADEGRPNPPVIILTGAAGTIGQAIAATLATRGAELALTDLDAHGLASLSEGLAPAGRGVFAHAADLCDAAQVERFVGAVTETFGRVDVCVFATGIEGPVAKVDGVTDEELALVFDVNVFAMFRILRAVLPVMRRGGGGRVVTIASGAGTNAAAYSAPYAASKHALVGLTRTIALDEAAAGICANAVCPGHVESPMLHRIAEQVSRLPGAVDNLSRSVPMGRSGQPAEVADLVAYLALSAPVYLTGAAIPIDGGMRA